MKDRKIVDYKIFMPENVTFKKFEEKEKCRWYKKESNSSTEISCLSSHEKNVWKFCPFCGKLLDRQGAK